ncbi:multidrug efflux SMR transporter [Halobacillus sp. Marseille-Q1614]|uniref:DMT family transporter n=1 Tax=Halobacillus sp. Marseille-Q1614 TaxID=2709134 RepID=UPI0015705063|nr:multidrug efflux SMR transporter [Halobacillus sp. Marseille-Q1614]
MAFVFLLFAVLGEVFGSTMLKLSDGFRKLPATLGVVAGYGAAFYLLSLSLKTLALGTVYALWAGLGTALTAAIGIWIFKEKMNVQKALGLAVIIMGVILLNVSGGH